MGIRLPLQGILDVTHTDSGSGSVAGGYAYPFKVPQDTDNIVVKFTPSVVAGGQSVFLQTSDDGGNTWYDVARTSIASNSGATAATGMSAQWITAGTISNGLRTAVNQSTSLLTTGIGAPAASTLASQQVSGLPILGLVNRVFLVTTGNATSANSRVQVFVNQQGRGGN